MKKILTLIMLLFTAIFSYSQILIDNGPIIINRQLEITPDYVIQGNSWDHRILTYWFSNGTNDITGNEERTAIRSAMDIWQNETDLRFLEVCDSIDADIILMWGVGDHGDGYPFDGTGGVLAHGFFPPPNGDYAGDIHFDDDETWTTATRSNSDQPIDLVTIAAHELGHSLGLEHSSVSSALMYAYYSGSHRYLDQDDINGIRSIYGSPGTYNFISDPSTVCPNGTTFTLENLPTVDSIIWSCGSYLYISSGQNTSTCTVSCTGEGSTWVGARLVTECGDIDLPHKTVHASGWPYGSWTQNGTSHTLNTVNFVQSGSQVSTTVYYTPASSFDWSLQSGSGVTWSDYCTSVAANLYLTLSSSGNATFVLTSNTSSCGTLNTTYTFAVGYMFSFVIAPNPASSEITVMRLDEQQAKGKAVLKPKKEKFKEKGFSPVDLSQEEYTVSLYSEKKGLLKTVKTSDENCKLDLRDLLPGTYFLHIENEYVLYQEQIIVEK